MNIEDMLSLLHFATDKEAHIKVNKAICKGCPHHACTYVCPANCYTLEGSEGELMFGYEGCLECGACYIVCDRGAIEWNYPRGGYGVCYRYT